MSRKKLLKNLAFLVFLILAFNFLAIQFYWYYTIWWFDMPMHFLGGLWVALAVAWLLNKELASIKSTLPVLLLVLVVGGLWEIYEIVVNNSLAQNPFNILDTISDLFFDLAGALAGLLYLRPSLL